MHGIWLQSKWIKCVPCKTKSVEQLNVTFCVSLFSFTFFVLKIDHLYWTKLTWEHWTLTSWGAPLGCIYVRGRVAEGCPPSLVMSLSALPLAPISFPSHCLLTFFLFSLGFMKLFHYFIPSLLLSFPPYMLPLCLSVPLLGHKDTPPPPPYSFLPFFSSISLPSFTVIGCLLLLSLLPSSLPCSRSCCCVCQCSSFSSRERRRLGCKIKPTLAIITELASCPL